MSTRRRGTAFAAGALYLITFLTSIPTLALYRPLREHADFVLGAGSATGVTWGVLLEVALALSCAGTAVVLYPVLRRRNETAALAFVTSRTLEAALILVGVVSMLGILTLRRGGAVGADASALVTAGHTLLGVYDATFLIGQSLMPVVNAAALGSVLYRSGLVPRAIPAIGLAGAPLLLASDVAILCGVYPRDAAVAGIAALPIALWELSLGAWLLLKGFRSAPVPAPPAGADRTRLAVATHEG